MIPIIHSICSIPETRTDIRQSADCPQNPAKLFAYPNATPQYAQVFTSFSSTTETKHEQSEDCLTLNIWTPARPAHTCAADPVMVVRKPKQPYLLLLEMSKGQWSKKRSETTPQT